VSLILDALNKSEQERTGRENAANIHAVHGSSPEQEKRLQHRRWFWEIMAVVLILVLVYFYTEFTTKALVPVPLIESTALPVETDSIAAVDRPVQKTVVEPVVMQELKPLEVEASSSDAVKQLYEQPEVIEAAPVIVEEEVVSAVVEPPIDENAQWIAVPLISELPPRISSGIASIDFSVHMYSDEEGASFVNLNGELHREDDMVAPGLRLVKIFEYGVVLDYQGTQFRLLPLSGWVNM
jgi:hypothetical protein